MAVTGKSPSLAAGELEQAIKLAKQIGIRHQIIATEEFSQENYLRNATDRCYHCKNELYSQVDLLLPQLNAEVVVNGANLDDLGDYRPGLKAASQHRVRSPLAECKIGKKTVRELAALWELPVWNKPASPCLSSRVAYGQSITPELLQRIDQAEQFLRQQGLPEVRVRCHQDDLARLEVPLEALARLCQEPIRNDLTRRMKALGFRFVTLDLEGFRSGSLNLVNIEPKPAR